MMVVFALVVGGFWFVVAWVVLRVNVEEEAKRCGKLKLEKNFPHRVDRRVASRWVDLTLDSTAWCDFWFRAGLVRSSAGVDEVPLLADLRTGQYGPVATVQMIAGQTLEEWEKAAPRMAPMLRVDELMVSMASPGVIAVEARLRDPLASTSGAVVAARLVDAVTPIPLGCTQAGDRVEFSLAGLDGHIVMQGKTRSGKSSLVYLLLSWALYMPDVQICGFDHSRILLGPLGDLPGWRAIGSDMGRHREVMGQLVAEIDRRYELLAARRTDKMTKFSAAEPLLLVIVEEWAGLVRSAERHDKASGAKPADRIGPQLEADLGRLVSEGAKVGIRVLLMSQRVSAKVIDTDSRVNFTCAITLRGDPDSVEMLHKDLDRDVAKRVVNFGQGRGFIESMQYPVTEWQADYLGGYDEYMAQISAAAKERGLAHCV